MQAEKTIIFSFFYEPSSNACRENEDGQGCEGHRPVKVTEARLRCGVLVIVCIFRQLSAISPVIDLPKPPLCVRHGRHRGRRCGSAGSWLRVGCQATAASAESTTAATGREHQKARRRAVRIGGLPHGADHASASGADPPRRPGHSDRPVPLAVRPPGAAARASGARPPASITDGCATSLKIRGHLQPCLLLPPALARSLARRRSSARPCRSIPGRGAVATRTTVSRLSLDHATRCWRDVPDSVQRPRLPLLPRGELGESQLSLD